VAEDVIKYCGSEDPIASNQFDFTMKISVFIFVAYILITGVLFFVEDKRSIFIMVLICFVYLVHQIHLIIRYSPMTNKQGMAEFRMASLI